ncbi:Stealth CR1 domain-containing protein [Marinomonas rhizomae]|uniref:Stealth CR1 domain-containing protein n=1 Tax=Marinomonas rhizomae TaxID=491948 RepID=UPI002107545F|nr:Stealth CR1 domain-containing protein [Marinomonas rhizomae]UTV98999.1 Stealth CR1 domain-containing protein [Marinomonas rhizomae]
MLSNTTELKLEPIDAVITWVDGSDAKHRQKRQKYMAMESLPLNENASNPHRWMCNDEILYCIQSIENHAPWIGKIWIVVDDKGPDLSGLSESIRNKVHLAYHAEIFAGFTHVLPTFNSLAIESMLWRIEGLSERFIYFNDDVFLAAPLKPTDVFDGLAPVLRGKWADFSERISGSEARIDPAKFHYFMQVNAAKMLGFSASELYSAAHVVHPFRRSKMAELFARFPDCFVNNIQYRFRNLEQFFPQGLHNHACIMDKEAKINTSDDHLHISSGYGKGQPPADTLAILQRATDPDIKFLCVNDLPQLIEVIPNAAEWVAQAIGGFSGRVKNTTMDMSCLKTDETGIESVA